MPTPDSPSKPTPLTSCGDCKTEPTWSCASLGIRGFPSQTTKPGARWHAEGQTQDHGRLPDSSGSIDLLCRSFLSLHSEEAATSVIDSTPSCLQWRRPTHLEFDPETNSPVVDEFGRCSDPTYYAAGNVVQASRNQAKVPIFYTAENFPNPVDDAGQCWSQGRTTAKNIAKDLSGSLP